LTFEYVLLAGLNDSQSHAVELAKLLAGRTAMLNVIPYNPVAGLPYGTPSAIAQATFRRTLEGRDISVHFRHRKGDAIDAACGQLRRRSAVEGLGSRDESQNRPALDFRPSTLDP